MMRYLLAALILLSASFTGALDLTGRVVDEAGLLNSAQKQKLEETLAAHEKATGNQIVVVTVKSLEGKSVEDFGYQLGRQWGIGKKEKSNGVLLIVAPAERDVRIEVGYGLEGVLTDAESRLIIERLIVPQFKNGRMDEGIIQGALGIIDALGGELSVPEPENQDSIWPFLLIGVFVLISLIFRSIFGGRGRGGRRGGGGFWGSGSSRGSGSGGTFRGGGGSFGGGGASGKW